MADRIEREIEEILAKLEEPPGAGERSPISIAAHRGKAKPKPRAARTPRRRLHLPLDPTRLMFTGAILVVGGLLLSNTWEPLAWASFAGVVLFLGSFGWSFFRRAPGAAAAPKSKGAYWRDRYIEYEPPRESVASRIRRKFRR